MRIHIDSFRHADAILRGAFSEDWRDVLNAIEEVRAKSVPIDMVGLRNEVVDTLAVRGWRPQPSAFGHADATDRTAYPGDFAKPGIRVACAFGPGVRLSERLLEFQVADTSGDADVAVLVTVTRRLASAACKGQPTREDALAVLPLVWPAVSIPITVVAMDASDRD